MIILDNNNYLPKYLQVKNFILKTIDDDGIQPGDKMPSENELRERYHVSRHTIRKALELLEREGLLEKRQGIGTFYQKRQMSLSRNIGFISISLYDYIFADILSGIDDILHQNDYQVILGNSKDSIERERLILEQFLDKNIDGLIIEPAKSAISHSNAAILNEFVKRNIPVVVLDSLYPEKQFNYVVVDDQKGGFLAVDYLIRMGHSRVAMIYKSAHSPAVERFKGYKNALQNADISICSELIKPYYNSEFEHPEKFSAEIRRICQQLLELEEIPTAIFCFNDQTAVLTKEILSEKGIAIPDDISLVGFDNSKLVKLNTISISSISHPGKKAGEKAAEIILSQIEGQQVDTWTKKIFKPDLVKRDSVKKLKEE
ncbi:MAG: substrate-binding domain-containing protein [Halanaerobiales bacterium]